MLKKQHSNGKDYVPGTTHLWRDLFRLVELTENMRQHGDATYAQLFNCVRTASASSYISVLKSRVLAADDLIKEPFASALHLLPTVE